MRLPAKCKVEKLVSKDRFRVTISMLYLRIAGEGDERKGYLEGTDSYKLARIPVEVSEHDTEGYIPVEAVTTARKLRVDELRCNGTVDVLTGESTAVGFPRPTPGSYCNTDSLLDVVPAQIDGRPFRIGLNPKLLAELAEGMGAETVTLEFTAVKGLPDVDGLTDFRPSDLRPMTVRPLGLVRGSGGNLDSVGLLMPVRR